MEPAAPPRRKKRLACIIASVITIIGLALGIGLGIGLKHKKDKDDGGDGDEGDSAPPRTEKWVPEVGASWQIILSKTLDVTRGEDLTPDVDVYDLDLFNSDRQTFAELQRRGKKVICYFSAGSYEDFRDDAGDFPEEDMGDELDGWPGERWLKLSSPKIRSIMTKRIQLAARKGCDGIDPDNVDGYQNKNGLGLTEQDSVDFMTFLSAEAAKHKLALGLKNAGDIIPDVLPLVDFSVNEQCAEYDECDVFESFVEDAKPVFQIEYPDGGSRDLDTQQAEERCHSKGAGRFSTVLKNMDLDGWVQYCDGETYDTPVEAS